MKKLICLLFFIFISEAFFATTIYACDGCGPSSGCNYIGVMPNFRKNFIGIRYNGSAFVTSPYRLIGDEMSKRTTYRFHSAEIWGRYFVNPRLQVIGILPYAYHVRNEGGTINTLNGLGDAVALANYTIYSTPDSSVSYWSHFVQAGGGVKLATGKYNYDNNNQTYHANFQPGSGSFDFLAMASYTIRYKKIGFRSEASYKYNTTNADAYKFGNKLSNNNSFFYWGAFDGDNAIVPQIGLYQEYNYRDVSNGFYEDNTGGTSRFLSCAADVYYSKISAGINVMLPIQQPKYEVPTSMQYNMRLHFNYFF